MAVQKITKAQRNLIKNASVHALSTRPGEQGKKEMDIKNAMYGPVAMLMDAIDGIIDEVNANIGDVDDKVSVLQNTVFKQDSVTRAIEYTLENNVAMAFTAEAESVEITIPTDVGAGFCCEISIKTGNAAPSVTFINESGKAFYKILYGGVVGVYNAPTNAVVDMCFYCVDGEIVRAIIIDLK